MTSNLSRGLAVLEQLARHVEGMSVEAIAQALQLSPASAQRVLSELQAAGFVRRRDQSHPYVLTLRLATLSLAYLASSGTSELIQPALDRLAAASGELARMTVVDGERLIWIAKAQGARGGLRYDVSSDPGEVVRLWSTANGLAWLSTLSDDAARAILARETVTDASQRGPNAPRSWEEFQVRLHEARRLGYATVHEVYEAGTSAIAAPVWHKSDKTVIGTVSCAGPAARLTPERMLDLAPIVLEAAEALSANSEGIRAAWR